MHNASRRAIKAERLKSSNEKYKGKARNENEVCLEEGGKQHRLFVLHRRKGHDSSGAAFSYKFRL